MAISSNRVVTFKDLYGLSVPSIAGTVESPFIPFYVRGIVPPDSSIFTEGGSGRDSYNSVYYYEKYSKRLKYLYYGYALIGLDSNTINDLTGPLERTVYPSSDLYISSRPSFYTNSSNTNLTSVSGIGFVPLWHFGNLTGYSSNTYGDEFAAWGYTSSIISANLIKYSEISTMDLRNPQTYEVFTEYLPLIDSSTGEIMKDEEGNTLYEEGESYMEIKSEDSQIL